MVSAATIRAALRPLPADARTPRRQLLRLVLWLLTALPFAVDLPVRSVPAVLVGLVLTAYVVLVAERLPFAALAVAAVTALLDWRYVLALALAGHGAGRRMAHPKIAVAVFPLVALVGTATALVLRHDLYDWSIRVGGLVVFGLFPWLVGLYRRQRGALVRAGWDRAAQLEEQQRIVAEQARLRERARIAHDMHDFLSHQLSLAALHAGALELDPSLAERHVRKVGELRVSIATATQQLREVISVLRDESDPAPMTPAGETISSLVDRTAAAGVDVGLEVLTDFDAVDAMRQRAAYRLVQEALTNATKHAPGAWVVVRLAEAADGLEVSVRNGPPGRPPAEDRVRGHKGLMGLRERARLLGGRLESGPSGDGFAVTMLLPREPEPGPAAAGTAPRTVEQDFRRASTRVQRSLLVAVLGPTAASVVLVLALMGLYGYDSFTSELASRDFDAMRPGDSRAELAEMIPPRQVPERGDGPPPPEPSGSVCEFYRSTAGFLPSEFDVYRLCFRDGRLASKDVLTR